jgi:hypothetical protein
MPLSPRDVGFKVFRWGQNLSHFLGTAVTGSRIIKAELGAIILLLFLLPGNASGGRT